VAARHRHSTNILRTMDGTSLFTQHWTPASDSQASVLIVHGFGEHSDRYEFLVNFLLSTGINVHSFDLRGHGRSSGKRGAIRSWQEFRTDLGEMVADIRNRSDNVLFLFGHSLGALIVLDFVLHAQPQVSGVVLSGPLLGQPSVSSMRLRLAQVLAKVLPHLSMNAGLDPAHLSRDPQVVAAYRRDRLVVSRATTALASEMMRTIQWVRSHAHEMHIPILILHGAEDALALPETSRDLIEEMTLDDKQRIEYAGGMHELHNDLGREGVFTDLRAWLLGHSAAPLTCSP